MNKINGNEFSIANQQINVAEDAPDGQSRSGKIDPPQADTLSAVPRRVGGEWRSARGVGASSPTLLPSEASAEASSKGR